MTLQDAAANGAAAAVSALVILDGERELFAIPLDFSAAEGGVASHPAVRVRALAGGTARRFELRGSRGTVYAGVVGEEVTLSRTAVAPGDIVILRAASMGVS